MDKDITSVRVGFKQLTMNKIHALKLFFRVDNEATAVAKSIDITSMIAKEIQDGGLILVERKDGTTYKFVFDEPDLFPNDQE